MKRKVFHFIPQIFLKENRFCLKILLEMGFEQRHTAITSAKSRAQDSRLEAAYSWRSQPTDFAGKACGR
jgi:hypothetical protein